MPRDFFQYLVEVCRVFVTADRAGGFNKARGLILVGTCAGLPFGIHGGNMWFVYFDESKENNRFFVYGALIVDSEQWNDAFIALKEFRRALKVDYGIYVSKVLHAWKFAFGKGNISSRRLSKHERPVVYRKVLTFIAGSRFFQVISCMHKDEFFRES